MLLGIYRKRLFTGINTHIAGSRWILEIARFAGGFELGLHQQVQFEDGRWHHAGGYYSVTLTRYWSWGRSHNYNDGPHDGFSLGFLHVMWSGDWCEKCYRSR